MSENSYDVIILGGGPGGYEFALAAAKEGLSVALIEKDKLGGTCLNYGCIPTKAYYDFASLLTKFHNSLLKDYSINFNFLELKKKKDQTVENLQEGIAFSLKKSNVVVIKGEGKLIDQNTVLVNDIKYFGKYIVIATGAKARVIPSFEEALTSKEILELEILPKRLAIIGGGVIGIEMASIFNAFGVEVYVIEEREYIIPGCDLEVSRRLLTSLRKRGIKFYLKTKVLEVKDKQLELDNHEKLEVDCILQSIGRIPNVDLGLDNVGIIYDKNGIAVDGNFQTNIDNIYAIGDVTGKNMLAHHATYSGYQALYHILGKTSKINFNLIPSCVFSFPEVSWIGASEEHCKRLGMIYEVHKGSYRSNGKAQAMNEVEGMIKVITSDNYIIGASIIGYDASTLIHEIALAIYNKMTVDTFKDVIHAHPTLNEIFTSCF